MGFVLTAEAEADLDDIWFYTAGHSGSDVGSRLVDTLLDHFWLLTRYPHIGRSRENDLRLGLRSFPVGEYVVFYPLQEQDVLILRVVHGRRDLGALLSH